MQVPHCVCSKIPEKGILWCKEVGNRTDTEATLQLVWSDFIRSRGMSRSYPHARRDTTQAFGIYLHGLPEWEEQHYDLQQVGQHEVQVSESFILVQGVLC